MEREGGGGARGEIPQDCCGTGNKTYSSEAVGKVRLLWMMFKADSAAILITFY